MRLSSFMISFATAAVATLAVMAFPNAGHAQGFGDWDPDYPVCLELYGFDGPSRECAYTSIRQCQVTASGRPAECVVNPYYAAASSEPYVTIHRHHRRHRRHQH